jgi:hypothetical protein
MRGRAKRAASTLAVALVAGALFVGGLLSTSTAAAEPVVVVHVRRGGTETADAEVVLRDADGIIGRCRTTAGTCEIRGVPPGRATVSARTENGDETPGRLVVIPPDGKVSLIVAVP